MARDQDAVIRRIELDLLFSGERRAGEILADLTRGPRNIDRVPLACHRVLSLSKAQQLVDEVAELAELAHDLIPRGARRERRDLELQHRERRPQLMRDVGGELLLEGERTVEL